MHPAGEHEYVRTRLDHLFRYLEIILGARCTWVGTQERLESDIRRRDGWVGCGGAGKPVRGLAVGEDEDDVRVWQAWGVAGVDERLEVRACGESRRVNPGRPLERAGGGNRGGLHT